jgi:RNA-directed DNA polymerase
VRQVVQHLPASTFVLKTDVQSYYASIDHHLLLDRLAVYIPDRDVLNLIAQYLQRCAERGGLLWEYRKGIALGSPLSPIIGAFFLTELDEVFEKLGLFYKRFMDDILVLAPTRWKLRTAVKVVNQVLASLGLAKHPDKTFIGRIEKGFDWLGYHISPYGLSVATKTLQHFVTRSLRLYEQELREGDTSSRLGDYVRRWVRWVSAGVAAGTSAVMFLPGLENHSQALPPR